MFSRTYTVRSLNLSMIFGLAVFRPLKIWFRWVRSTSDFRAHADWPPARSTSSRSNRTTSPSFKILRATLSSKPFISSDSQPLPRAQHKKKPRLVPGAFSVQLGFRLEGAAATTEVEAPDQFSTDGLHVSMVPFGEAVRHSGSRNELRECLGAVIREAILRLPEQSAERKP